MRGDDPEAMLCRARAKVKKPGWLHGAFRTLSTSKKIHEDEITENA